MLRPRPRIAVTTSQRSGWRVYPLVSLNLWLTGGRGVRWGVGREANLDAVDGLIIGGGDDISPMLYGAKLKMEARLDPARDQLEHDLAVDALARDIPVLGICRGAQMLNIALGGTLHQDAFAMHPEAKPIKTILPRRQVWPDPEAHLSRICGGHEMHVNALHTQSVDRLGRGLRIAAKDSSGMVQAIERLQQPFALGVQWHPEHLFYARRQRAIFAALVAAAQAHRAGHCQRSAVQEAAEYKAG